MAIIIPALPYTLTNGTLADANQVMANFNDVVSGVNSNGAHNGANSDITSLTGLTTPISPAGGGTGLASPGPTGNIMTSTGGGLWQSTQPGQGLQPDPGGTGILMISFLVPPQGRLTLSSGVPVQTADVVAAGTIYYTPYIGNAFPWYDGVKFNTTLFSQLSLPLDSNAAHAGYHAANTNFDLFLYVSGGNPQLVTGPAWASATARSAAISYQSGILVNTAPMAAKFDTSTNTYNVGAGQATYIGTFRTVAAGQTQVTMNPAAASGGSLPQILLWNNYNRRLFCATCRDNGIAYGYTSATIRQARGSANNAINFVTGLAEDALEVTRVAAIQTPTAVGSIMNTGIMFDTTSAYYGNQAYTGLATGVAYTTNSNISNTTRITIDKQIGFHAVAPGENADGTHAPNFDFSSADFISLAGFF